MIVLTDSMYPEIQSGDLIICHTEDAKDVKVGDIICFYDPDGNGNIAWKTQGDANNTEDASLVPAKNLVGVYQHRFPNLGNVAMFMQTTQGLIICVVCPIILLIAYDMIRRRIYEKSKKKDTEALMAELEALRAEKEKKDREQ